MASLSLGVIKDEGQGQDIWARISQMVNCLKQATQINDDDVINHLISNNYMTGPYERYLTSV